MDKTIKIKIENHYGNTYYYVTSEHKYHLQELTGKKTLTPKNIISLKVLGFTFEKESESVFFELPLIIS